MDTVFGGLRWSGFSSGSSRDTLGQKGDQRSRLYRYAVKEGNVRYIVPIIYLHLLPLPAFMDERFRNLYYTTRNPTDANMQFKQIDVPEYVSREGVIMEGYIGTREIIVTTEHMGCPLPEDRPGLPTYFN